MCDDVIHQDREMCTVGDLRAVCPRIVWFGREAPDDACLCVVDVPATAEANGYVATRTIWGFELHLLAWTGHI